MYNFEKLVTVIYCDILFAYHKVKLILTLLKICNMEMINQNCLNISKEIIIIFLKYLFKSHENVQKLILNNKTLMYLI